MPLPAGKLARPLTWQASDAARLSRALIAALHQGLQPAASSPVSATQCDETAEGRGLCPLRILLVEDNSINQRVASILLEKRGHTVTVACNGRQAIDLFDEQAFDVILMDVQMPEMDGFEATAAIRTKEKARASVFPFSP